VFPLPNFTLACLTLDLLIALERAGSSLRISPHQFSSIDSGFAGL
jgi:hypothetical protein